VRRLVSPLVAVSLFESPSFAAAPEDSVVRVQATLRSGIAEALSALCRQGDRLARPLPRTDS
jgi:hypothetical protein